MYSYMWHPMDIILPNQLYEGHYGFFLAMVGIHAFDHTGGPTLVSWTGNWLDMLDLSTCSRRHHVIWIWYCGHCHQPHQEHAQATRIVFDSVCSRDHLATALSLCYRCCMAWNQRVSIEARRAGNFLWCYTCDRWVWHSERFPHDRAPWHHDMAPYP